MRGLRIGHKLISGFAVCVILSAIIGAVAVVQLARIKKDTIEIKIAENIEKKILECRRQEKNLLLFGPYERPTLGEKKEKTYLEKVNNNLIALRDLVVEEGKKIAEEEEEEEEFNAILVEIENYETFLKEVEANYKKREEIIERLRASGRIIQTRVQNQPVDREALDAILEVRRQEKNYMLFRSDEYVNKVKSRITALKKLTKNEETAKLTDEYSTLFNLFVENTRTTDAHIVTMRKNAREVQRITREIIRIADMRIDNAHKTARNVVRLTLILAVVFGSGVGIFLSRNITNPIRKLADATINIAKGDLTQRVDIKSNDEISDLARSFNKMTGDLSVSMQKEKEFAAAVAAAAETEKKRAAELEKARDYIDNIIKSMVDTLIVVNPDAKIETINPAIVELLGYKENELIGKPVATIFAEEEEEEEDTPFRGTRLKKLIEEGSIRDYELTYKTKSGEKIPVSFSGSVMRDEQGKLVGIVGVARDMRQTLKLISDLKRRTFELKVLSDISNAISYTLDYRELFKLIMASLYKVVDYDVCASFLFTPLESKPLTGFTKKEGANLIFKASRAVTRDFVEEVEKSVIEALSSLTGQAIGEKDISVTFETMPRPGKGEKALTKVNSFSNIPLVIENKTVGMLNVSSSRKAAFNPADIRILNTISNQAATAIGRLRGVIATEKSKMEAMVESMTEGLIMMDREGDPVVCNPAARQMFGLAQEEINRKRLEECFKKTGLDLAYEEIIFGRKELVTKDITITEPIKMDLRADIAPVKDIEGKKLGMAIVLRDITTEKEVDRMKTEFISTVSHELRTPLTTMKEFVSIVLDGIPGKINKDQKEYLNIVKGNIDRLARIIASLLDISRIEARRVELRKTLVNIVGLAKDTVTNLKVRADAKHIILETSFPRTLSDVYADPDRITQVFTNLIENAIKFTPEAGRIAVEIKARKKEIECSVSDTGIGIAPQDKDKVFERFRQIGRTAGAGAKGTGLGLPITKELVQMHKGRIWVESKLDKGSKFIFTLPKYTTESLFKEYVNNGITEAIEKDSKMSLVVISISNFNRLKQKLSDEKIGYILKDMEGTLNGSLRRKGDVALKGTGDTGEVIILLADCDKENALRAEDRLKLVLKDYLAREKLADKIKLRFGCATYPDEAKEDRELIEKAKKS